MSDHDGLDKVIMMGGMCSKLPARVRTAQRRRRREALTRAKASAESILERRAADEGPPFESERGTRVEHGLLLEHECRRGRVRDRATLTSANHWRRIEQSRT